MLRFKFSDKCEPIKLKKLICARELAADNNNIGQKAGILNTLLT